MINIKLHKPFAKKFATVYLKGEYFSIYAVNLYFFGVTFDIWEKKHTWYGKIKSYLTRTFVCVIIIYRG